MLQLPEYCDTDQAQAGVQVISTKANKLDNIYLFFESISVFLKN